MPDASFFKTGPIFFGLVNRPRAALSAHSRAQADPGRAMGVRSSGLTVYSSGLTPLARPCQSHSDLPNISLLSRPVEIKGDGRFA